MKIIGIDIGFRNTGWVIAEVDNKVINILDCGCLHTEKNKDKKVKVSEDDAATNQYIFSSLLEIISTHQVEHIAIELPTSGAKSASAMKSMCMAAAVVACVCIASKLPYTFISPNQVKRIVAGEIRKVEKDEVMGWVKNKYGSVYNFPKTKKDYEHIADAVVVLEACINNNK